MMKDIMLGSKKFPKIAAFTQVSNELWATLKFQFDHLTHVMER